MSNEIQELKIQELKKQNRLLSEKVSQLESKLESELSDINIKLEKKIDTSQNKILNFENKILKLENKSLQQEQKIIKLETENESLKKQGTHEDQLRALAQLDIDSPADEIIPEE